MNPVPHRRKLSSGSKKNVDLFGSYLKPNTTAFKANLLTSTCQVCDERNGSRKEHGSPVQMKHHGSGRAGVLQTTEAKNLAEVETREKEPMREGTPQTVDVKGKIIEFLWHLKRKGKYAESTIKQMNQLLRLLIKNGVNLLKPDSITDFLATKNEWSASYKNQIASVYNSFAKFIDLQFEPPVFKSPEKLPFIPMGKEIDQLIAGCGPKTSSFLQLLKETGMRAGEASQLKWEDVDFENNTVRVTPLKHGRARQLRISDKLNAMLRRLPHESIRIWPASLGGKRDNFTKQRRRLALKLGNPRLNRIHFHTLRHWKATMEYHKTKDILHVMQMLGHRRIQSTLIYTQLINFEASHYISRVAKNAKGARALVEAGFEYVCTTPESLMVFRKTK